MPLGKRARSSFVRKFRKIVPARPTLAQKYMLRARTQGTRVTAYRNNTLRAQVSRLNRMIETKEAAEVANGILIPHNNVVTFFNMFRNIVQGTGDPMGSGNSPSRIGDSITLKGVSLKIFLESAANRPKVYYRVMVLKCAKGDTVDRSTMFKDITANKMIDQLNTERFTIVAQRVVNVTPTNPASSGVRAPANGEPITQATNGGVASKIINMWIPGTKFTRGGIINYENGSAQPKFYDYKVVILAYDWISTPQDTNNVGLVNAAYYKCYFKDA